MFSPSLNPGFLRDSAALFQVRTPAENGHDAAPIPLVGSAAPASVIPLQ